jgi:phosphoribosyl 1,2-cyclic phosphate phosphodiesterase
LKITFLGSGTSTGVPLLACNCAVCVSTNRYNKRLRSSILVESNGVKVVVDASTDFRTQCLRARIDNIDAIICTHEHSDHLLGLDEVRRFCFVHDKRIPLYGSAEVLKCIRRIFPYAVIQPPPYKGLPELDLHEIKGAFTIGNLRVTPYRLPHGPRFTTLGLEFTDGSNHFAYFTDCSAVPPETCRAVRGIPLLILDALRHTPHPTHLNLKEALKVVKAIRPKRAFFTHLGHEFDYRATNAQLPDDVALAYDGLVMEM